MTVETAIRPIRTERDYERALRRVEGLMGAREGSRDGDTLDILVTLIEAYEARHWPVGLPDPIEAIKVRMEQRDLRPRDLEPFIGSRGRVSEVLNRRRALTLPMIRKLEAGLGIPVRILVQEPRRAPRRRAKKTTG